MKKFGLGVVVGVVLVCLLGLCFFLGTRVANKEDSKETNKTTENTGPVDLKQDDKLVKEAMKTLPTSLCGGYNYRLDGKSRTVDKFKDNEKIAMLFATYSDEVFAMFDTEDYEDLSLTLNEEDFKKYFTDLSFLDSVKKEKEGIGLDVPPAVLKYENGKFVLYPYATGCTGPGNDAGYIFFEKATKDGDKLTVRYIYAYIKYSYDEKKDEFITKYYRAEGDKKTVNKEFEEDYENNVLTGDTSGFDRYEFVYDIADGNMRIKEINFVKSE